MTANKSQYCSVGPRNQACVVLSFFLFVVLPVGGCGTRNRPVRNWRGVGLIRPTMPGTVAPKPRPLSDDNVDPVPELHLEIPPPPPLLAVHYTPPRPHVMPVPAAENANAGKGEVPIIAPQLSAAESSAAQQQMTSSLSIAEKNLARSEGRKLNPTQTDL